MYWIKCIHSWHFLSTPENKLMFWLLGAKLIQGLQVFILLEPLPCGLKGNREHGGCHNTKSPLRNGWPFLPAAKSIRASRQWPLVPFWACLSWRELLCPRSCPLLKGGVHPVTDWVRGWGPGYNSAQLLRATPAQRTKAVFGPASQVNFSFNPLPLAQVWTPRTFPENYLAS